MTQLKTLIPIIPVLLLLIVSCTRFQAIPPSSPQESKIAPDFTLTDLKGESVSLKAFKGKPILLNFWASWCGACRYEMPYFQTIFTEKTEVILLTINIKESQHTVSDFMKRNNYTFPVLLDSDGKVSQKYQIQAIPVTFLIDKNGIIKGVKVGAFQNKAEIEDFLKGL